MELVDVPDAPRPPGPFSHAAVMEGWVFTSGMGGLDPRTGHVVSDDVVEQARQALRNTEAILRGAGCSLGDVVKATVYLTDMADYDRVNRIYEAAFAPHRPARTCVAVAGLPVRERMKLDTIAIRPAARPV
jgi:2-iminobutanoate/2-iminopropanoate deaminase